MTRAPDAASGAAAPALSRTGPRALVRKLILTRFRSYGSAQLSVDQGPIVLSGPNGAGKTNLLEAISLLSPGRGLRRAALDTVAQHPGDGSWAVAAEIEGICGPAHLGTGMDAGAGGARRCRIERESVTSATAFLDHLKVVWLTPDMDGLFIGPPSDRRRFLDRLVLAVDGTHGTRVNALERALRARNRLLEEGGTARFLDAVERELAELAIAVAAARLETVARLAAEIAADRDTSSPFPLAAIALDGNVERMLSDAPALRVEDSYRALLRDSRPRDRAAGRTLEGPHLSDLTVAHAEKALPAARCSTGEQKSLLIGLALSHARLVASMQGLAPIVLLDDVAAYLDAERRLGLFAALARLGAQVWMTGADPSVFAGLDGARRFTVSPGSVVAED
ncbi:MAG: DNA replication/repair protein RecF [Rhizobiales bacterium 24-66-13]|jgi:DNA replication and repair protein RecF|uniref:DNA replication/repair protein RecF n=1 Tax=Roseixanthobacter finlandensis TaxID=3119922 RepID=UPI000BD25ED5|nr:MAG: DNA replication/repair protein RecF [Rhizobiales bacterium 35-66-30]OYZ68000.1 MAG: DNA replication/repair protein RecF [Rhizobiales bacterium 24-66-13]OZB03533.1 MAG: DNA replication/repair protein RecF [Rhizobiales bacterium 39-66-18]HQS11215.1 DNA replication/repair protein RecF [Xanthobacteraceae bacterium]